MKIKRFVLGSRAEDIKVDPQLIAAIKKLKPDNVQKLFKKFIPLDLAALIQKYNARAFDKVLIEIINKSLRSARIKNIMEYVGKLEKGYQKNDAVQDVLMTLSTGC